MQDPKTLDLETLDLVTGGSTSGEVCRAGYEAGGGWIGAVLTSETLGWGGIPGAIIGRLVGNAVCRP